MTEVTASKYAAKDIASLETMVAEAIRVSREATAELYELLTYLKTTGRYKENRTYARESFTTYLEDRFSIRYAIYQDWGRVFNGGFKEEAIRHGVGLVAKTINSCGRQRAKAVWNEVEKLADARKSKTVPREKIETIIQKYRRTPVETPERVDWRAKYHNLKAQYDEVVEKYRAALATIEEQAKQIERLKGSAGLAVGITKMVQAHQKQLQA